MTTKTNTQQTPHSAETRLAGNQAGKTRGRPQRPHTAESAASVGCSIKNRHRVISVKLKLDKDQWARLRELAWQAAQYKNFFIRALWAQAVGLRVDPSEGDKNDVSKHIRKHHKGELSSACYVAAEGDARNAWNRDGKKIMAGAPMSQWSQNNSLGIHGHKDRSSSGIRIVEIDNRFYADIMVQSKECEGGCWMRVRIAKGTERDEYHGDLLSQMAAGSLPVRKGLIRFVPTKGKTFLHLAYRTEVAVPEPGKRVASIGWLHEKRFLLRTECETIDYTSRLTTIATRKIDWDTIKRRIHKQIGKKKGGQRAKRRHGIIKNDFHGWSKGYLHEWTADIVKWCAQHGVGRISIADLKGGDWPAHMFEQLLTYKCDDQGIAVDHEPNLADAGTERAAKAIIRRERSKARKIGQAARTIANQR